MWQGLVLVEGSRVTVLGSQAPSLMLRGIWSPRAVPLTLCPACRCRAAISCWEHRLCGSMPSTDGSQLLPFSRPLLRCCSSACLSVTRLQPKEWSELPRWRAGLSARAPYLSTQLLSVGLLVAFPRPPQAPLTPVLPWSQQGHEC